MKTLSLFVLVLLACEPRTGPVEPPPSQVPSIAEPHVSANGVNVAPSNVAPTPTVAPPASTQGAKPAPETPSARPWFGVWSSPSCGARKYERRLTLTKEGTFQAEDRISPCPAGVACVWSGIVARKGKAKIDGTTLELTPEPNASKQGEPLATKLVWDDAKAAPVESADGITCVYARVP